MDYTLGTIGFGLGTLVATTLSVLYWKDQFVIQSFISGVSTIILSIFSGYYWNFMLLSSGKSNFLLGFERYPMCVGTLIILDLIALIYIVKCVKVMRQK